MNARAIDVLRVAHSFHCLKCDEHANCRKNKQMTLKNAIGKLLEMAQNRRLEQHTLSQLVSELQAQKRCFRPSEAA